MGRQARDTTIIRRQEALALRLLDRSLPAGENEPGIDVQLDVFEKVGKWVAIKNRLEDVGDTRIDEFKARIAGTADKKRGPDKTEPPSRLVELQKRLPSRTHGGVKRDRDGAGGEDAVTP